MSLSSPLPRAASPPIARPPEVRAENLSLRYGGTLALDRMTLTAASGRITALVGPSGCGKSSFIACVNRLVDLVPKAEVEGSVFVGDLDVYAPRTDPVRLRRDVGMIFQKPCPFPFSIRENIAIALREHVTRRRGEIEEITERALRDVGLFDEVKDRLDALATELSGGQQQRLSFARALALRPSALLLDEPTSALDPLASAVVEDLIRRLRGEYTVVLVTHDLAQARRLADDVAVFWLQEGAGRIIEQGPVRRVFESPREELTARYVRGLVG